MLPMYNLKARRVTQVFLKELTLTRTSPARRLDGTSWGGWRSWPRR